MNLYLRLTLTWYFSIHFELDFISYINIPILIYSQQDATLHRLFYLETALRVSDGTSSHH